MLLFPEAGVSAVSLMDYGRMEVSEFALEHSNGMSNPERERENKGRPTVSFFNTSFTAMEFWKLPYKSNCHLCMCCCLESVWKFMQLDQRRSQESELAAIS